MQRDNTGPIEICGGKNMGQFIISMRKILSCHDLGQPEGVVTITIFAQHQDFLTKSYIYYEDTSFLREC